MADISNAVNIKMVEFVKAYALNHYEEGWDFIYECYDNEDIIDITGNCGKDWGTFQEALKIVAEFVRIYNDYKNDIINS